MEKTIIVVTLACLCLLTPSFGLDFSKSFQKKPQSEPGEELNNNNIDPLKLTTYPTATDPRKFSYNINDGIEGALQIRHETWEDGVVKGYYTYPLGEKMWQLVHYIADAQGYRITSTKSLTEAELLKMSDQTMDEGSASIQLEEDGLKTNYKINRNDINQTGKRPAPMPIPIPIQLKKVREAAELADQMKEKLDKNENGTKVDDQDEKLKSTEDKKDQKENETSDAKSSPTEVKDQKDLKKKFPLKYRDDEV